MLYTQIYLSEPREESSFNLTRNWGQGSELLSSIARTSKSCTYVAVVIIRTNTGGYAAFCLEIKRSSQASALMMVHIYTEREWLGLRQRSSYSLSGGLVVRHHCDITNRCRVHNTDTDIDKDTNNKSNYN